jgi:hypothetical protein
MYNMLIHSGFRRIVCAAVPTSLIPKGLLSISFIVRHFWPGFNGWLDKLP